ncbi:MAG: hypothetical protein NTW59_00360 [Candidatus Diapherotrites archaeon]|nr:hypothetical protein [Candidatus Diapherotrites archaeon]
MAKAAQPNSSIIQVIQEMVKNGESEERIIKSLRDLGIEEEKAKRLLLLGQADTFALLQNEIGKIVKNNLENEKPELIGYIKGAVEKQEDEMTTRVEKRALGAFREDQKFIENQAMMFQARVNQSVKNILQLNDETKKNTNALGNRLSNTERDVWAIKYKVFGGRVVKAISLTLIAMQLGVIVASAYLFFTAYSGIPEETLLLAILMGSLLASMFYLIGMRV